MPIEEEHKPVVLATFHVSRHKNVPTNDVEEIVGHAKRAEVRHLGSEFVHTDIDRADESDPNMAFWRNLRAKSTENGIELREVEPRALSSLFLAVRNAHEQGVMNQQQWLAKIFDYRQIFSKYAYRDTMGKLLDHLSANFEVTHNGDLHRLLGAINVARSVYMYEHAQKLGLSHVVIGTAHACHLEELYNLKPIHMDKDNRVGLIDERRRQSISEIEDYTALKPLIGGLLEILRKEQRPH